MIVNLISTSLVFEVADIISPEVKVPLIFDISNSVIDAVPSWNESAVLTIAVAPDDAPVISWSTISSPSTVPTGVHRNTILVHHLPSDSLNIYSVE